MASLHIPTGCQDDAALEDLVQSSQVANYHHGCGRHWRAKRQSFCTAL
jgi:hypothetical protein